MKKRIIALSLAASMLLGSFNVVFADNDVETTTANETVYDSENAVSEDISSDNIDTLESGEAIEISENNESKIATLADVEVGEWETNGNGVNGQSSNLKKFSCEVNDDNSVMKLSIGGGVGKLSGNEDSYSYRAMKASIDEGFQVTANIDAMSICSVNTSTTNPHQAASGFIIFDSHYVKGESGQDGNSMFVGIIGDGSKETTCSLVIRVKKDGEVTYNNVVIPQVGNIGQDIKNTEISVTKTGNSAKVKINDMDSVDVDLTGVFNNNQYIGYMVARDGKIDVSNNQVITGLKAASSVEVLSYPEKTEYYVSEPFDSTGLSLNVTYTDGSTAVIDNPDEFSVSGFEDSLNKSFNTTGDKTLTVGVAGAYTEIPVTVRKMKLVSLNVDYTPIYDTFYVGGKFNFTGMEVTAKFENGTEKKLTADEYILAIGDTVITSGVTTVTEDMVSPDTAVIVRYNDVEGNIDTAGVNAAFYINVDPGKLTKLEIGTWSFKQTYYIGDEKFDPNGLTVNGVYTDSNGKTSYQLISSDLYTITGFDSSNVNENLEMKITYNEDPSIYCTFTIKVLQANPLTPEIEAYPRLTYNVGEAFDASGLKFGIFYSDDSVKILSENVFFYKNGTEYYKIYNNDVTEGEVTHLAGEKVAISEAELNAADFYIDLTDYDSSAVGVTSITIYINEKYGAAAMDPITWNISIVEATDYVWKSTVFGQSSGSSYVTAYKDGKEAGTTTTRSMGVTPVLMEDGKIDDYDRIDVVSWNGAGKITTDHDGIAYYYTKVDANNNFTISADITVNRYIDDPENLSDTNKTKYNNYIAQGYTEEEALDRIRSGQEAFGIMARDVIPLGAGVVDGEFKGDSYNMTVLASDAVTADYTFTKNDGSTVTYTTPANYLEAALNGLSVTDANGVKYTYERGNTTNVFNSNVVIAGAVTDSSFPTDPNSSSYNTKALMNRINIFTRFNGERVGIYSTTNHLPMKGDKYNITLTKMNTGYMITTYDYQTGTTATQYSFDVLEETTGALTTQDPDNIYVGFFAARYADISVENIELYETMTATDPNISGSVDEAVAPKITIDSPYYTSNENYTLIMRSNSTKGEVGGLTSVSLNGKTILSDITLGNRKASFDVNLVPDEVNYFSVIYYPNTADNFTSYDPVITRFTVTHKSESLLQDMKKIYVSPDGTMSGDGSIGNPLPLEMALYIVDYGGEIIMLDGTYNLTNEYVGKISLGVGESGYQNGNYKMLRADEGANPVIDLQEKFAGFEVDADYWYFKGITITHSADNTRPFSLGGDHCVVENCTFANNNDTGFQISRITSEDKTIDEWPAYNLVKGCESYNNIDPSQNNADGFGSKLTVGYGNVFQDCIAHHNIDDGWDCYTKIGTGAIGAVVLENCITYDNGYIFNEETGENIKYDKAEGNGFKMGGEGVYVNHYIKDSISFNNRGSGITTNNNPAMTIRNVISYKNEGNNFTLGTSTSDTLTDAAGNAVNEEGKTYKFNYNVKGAVSVGSGDSIGSYNSDMDFANISSVPVNNETNYLSNDRGKTSVNSLGEILDPDTFFVSTNSSDVLDENMRYSRNADGSFDHGDFLARVTPYEHEAADIVTLPDIYGGEGGIGLGVTTEGTTAEPTTEAPQQASRGAGGGGSVKNYTAATTTEGTTSEVVEEDTTEATTEETAVFTDSVAVQVGSKDISINNNSYTMDVAPYIQSASNSTMVPLRFVAIAVAGGNVEAADSSNLIVWDAAAKTATITAGSDTIVFTAGSGTYTVNGSTLNISNQAVAEIVDGRMFVPFRTIGEALGAEVSWDADTKTAMYN